MYTSQAFSAPSGRYGDTLVAVTAEKAENVESAELTAKVPEHDVIPNLEALKTQPAPTTSRAQETAIRQAILRAEFKQRPTETPPVPAQETSEAISGSIADSASNADRRLQSVEWNQNPLR